MEELEKKVKTSKKLGLRIIVDSDWRAFHCPSCEGVFTWRPRFLDFYHECDHPRVPIGY